MAHTEPQEHLEHGGHPHAYDRGEPDYRVLLPFTLICVVLFVAVVFGVQMYYSLYHDNVVYEKVLAPESQELKAIRDREDQQLHSYGTVDKEKGIVRIPIDRAMELVAADAVANKPKYNTKSYSPAAAAAAAQAAAAAAAAAAAPVPGAAPAQPEAK